MTFETRMKCTRACFDVLLLLLLHPSLNSSEYDGGDCCPCTCQVREISFGSLYAVGVAGIFLFLTIFLLSMSLSFIHWLMARGMCICCSSYACKRRRHLLELRVHPNPLAIVRVNAALVHRPLAHTANTCSSSSKVGITHRYVVHQTVCNAMH